VFSSHVKIRIDKSLYQRLSEAATAEGYSSTDELIRHVLERAADAAAEEKDDRAAAEQLRGLGYLDS
jgi:metal-responsive CopG/Arc/MetJ family transcriptional regulator